jgi:hypothetical protein
MWHSILKPWRSASLRSRTQAPQRRIPRLTLENLEDRTVPSTFNAATVSDLIADIKAANQAGGSNTIILAPNTTFDLIRVNNKTNGATGLPVIAGTDNLTIIGQGGDIIQRDAAAPAFRLLDVASGASLTLQNLTLQGGLASGSGSSAEGGGIYNQGTLVLSGVTVQNDGAQGSAGTNSSKKNVTAGNGNSASGGGIYSSGSLTLENGTVVQNNWATGGAGGSDINGYGGNGGNAFGGGVYIAGGSVQLTSTNVSSNGVSGGSAGQGQVGGTNQSGWTSRIYYETGNPGAALGGGLYVASGAVILSADTVDSNVANGGVANGGPAGGLTFGAALGGGLYVASGTVTLSADTVGSNVASDGGGLFVAGGTVTLSRVTVDSNRASVGGGLFVAGGTVTLSGDTVDSNVALYAYYGGGLFVEGGSVCLTNSTVEYNQWGGVYIATNAQVCLDSFTVANIINNLGFSNISGSYTIC